MKITYYGHACFGVSIGHFNLLIDPFITPNELAKHIDLDTIPADYLLITHGHADHVADAMTIAQRTGACIVSNFEIVSWFQGQGVKKGHPMNLGGSWTFDFGRLKYVNAIHTSSMPDGAYGGNPGGFVIETLEGNLYHSGDTALTMDMQLIAESTDIGVAMLCIGDNFTMGVDDALIASNFIKCDRIIGMHYDTFPPIRINREEARLKFQSMGKELVLMPIGGTLEI